LHMWMRDNLEMSVEEKVLLDLFIETQYGEHNNCLKHGV